MESKDKSFPNKKRFTNSFRYAWCGIKTAFKEEQNLKVHMIATGLVLLFGFLFKISYVEWLICLILIGMVISLEIINTAIEATVDLACPKIDPKAKVAKDAASGAVLVMAIISAIIGGMIFLPKIINWLGEIL